MGNNDVCTIHGYLYGLICQRLEVLDAIRDARIWAVASKRDVTGASMTGAAGAQEGKRAVKALSGEELKAATAGASLSSATDDKGRFCLMDPEYRGGAVDIYVLIDRVPLPGSEEGFSELPEPQALFLGTYLPVASDEGWVLSLVIPQSVWCRFKRLADAWTIVGRVSACGNPQIPLGGVTVTAFDVDWTQDDELEQDVTTAAGIYRIDYPGWKYREGTFIDVELFGGPDLYFKIVDADGNTILDEPSSRGRTAERCDRGPCACIDLCGEVPVPDDGDGLPVPSVWTGVGTAFTIPDAGSLNDFDADGYAGAAKFALTTTARMTGSADIKTSAANPIEYRFRVSDTTAANTDPPLAEANFTRVVGKSPDDDLFVTTKVCEMIRYSPYKIVKVYAKVVDLDSEGWLDVNKSIQRTFIERPDVDPLDLPDFVYVDSDGLMAIDTAKLTTTSNVSGAGLDPGDPVPAGDQIGIEKFAIRFEVREVIDKATDTYAPLPGDGWTVNAFVMNNNARYGKLAMKEHLLGTPCDVLSGSIHAAYTVHHPHLRDVSLTVVSNDGAYNVSLSDPPMPLAANVNPAVTHLHNASLALPNSPPNTLHKCTYLVQLHTRLRLHTGDGAASSQSIPTTFFWDPAP